VLLDADPLADVANVSRIDTVIVRGRVFDRAARARLLDDVARAPDVAVNDWPRAKER
jgi:hypothetical protein